MTKSAEIKIRLEDALLQEVEALAAEMGKSKSEVLRAGILALREKREKRMALDMLKRMAAEQPRSKKLRFKLE
jgi:Arc/MetJ-type ribon-helix-helix transcriptional regulator